MKYVNLLSRSLRRFYASPVHDINEARIQASHDDTALWIVHVLPRSPIGPSLNWLFGPLCSMGNAAKQASKRGSSGLTA